ncbi:MAG TPA: hypothetical protein VM534_00505 [Thermoanaerobaculia bacterium]|nr:hypothetical protein [Thermoanaerobaculia bacterium]
MTLSRRTIPFFFSLFALFITSAAFGQAGPFSGTAITGLAAPTGAARGSDFTVELRVDLRGVSGKTTGGASTPAVLGGYQIEIAFDKTRVQYIEPAGGSTAQFASIPTATGAALANAEGSLVVAASQTSSSAPTGLVSVAVLTFRALADGNAAFTVDPLSLSSAFQGTGSPASIPATGSTAAVAIGQAPGAVANLSPANNATNVGSPVNLSWSAASGATGYSIYMGTGLLQLIATTSTTSHSTAVQSGQTYSWRITANNAFGSTDGPVWQFTTAAGACTTPAAPVVTVPAQTDSGLGYTVSWTATPGATHYLIEEALNGTFSGASSSTVSSSQTSRSFEHVACQSTRYYYRVRGLNQSDGCSISGPFSTSVSVLVVADGSNPPPPPSGLQIVPVVGSLQGLAGSFFRTSVQFHNPYTTPIAGRFIFHPLGVSGTPTDPSLSFALDPGETEMILDVINAMGIEGIGSLDIVADVGNLPVGSVRIFNDAGALGTSGLSEDFFDPSEALMAGEQAALIVSPDQNAARYNVGVRTLDQGATISVTVIEPDGSTGATIAKSYPANMFVQTSVAAFVEAPVSSNATLRLTVDAGSAFIYGTLTDNLTNDPNLQLALRIRP